MKNELCISTFVFGKDYQEYIPLYIWSILKSYPDYYPLIISEHELVPHVAEQIEILRDMGDFKIITGLYNEHKLHAQRAKSFRWVLDAPEYKKFKAVYVGDIDIIIIREEPSLFFQHWTHCDILGLPYSNIVRKIDKQSKHYIARFKKTGFKGVLISLLTPRFDSMKLTGLHFFKTEEYLKLARPYFKNFYQMIVSTNLSSLKKTRHHHGGFQNESVLYDLMQESGVGVPPAGPYGSFMLDYKNYQSPWFRPHHGIHLAAFRTEKQNTSTSEMLSLPFYRQYYKDFCTMKDDHFYGQISNLFSDYLQVMLKRMDNYYNPTNVDW